MKITVKNSEIRTVKTHFENGGYYGNIYCTFSKGSIMVRIDNKTGDTKIYNNEDKFYRAVVRFTKKGY